MHKMIWLAVLALLGPGIAAAQARRHDTGMEPLARASAMRAASGGVRVFVDPNTHEIMSQPVDRAQRERAARKFALTPRNDDLMWIERRADGSEFLHTEGQIMMNAVVRPDSTGGFQQTCLPGADGRHEEPTR